MKREKPRMLYIALGETDDFAHLGQYDHYLNLSTPFQINGLKTVDVYSIDDNYRINTLITTDHGRGVKPMDKWTDHGSDVEGSSRNMGVLSWWIRPHWE